MAFETIKELSAHHHTVHSIDAVHQPSLAQPAYSQLLDPPRTLR